MSGNSATTERATRINRSGPPELRSRSSTHDELAFWAEVLPQLVPIRLAQTAEGSGPANGGSVLLGQCIEARRQTVERDRQDHVLAAGILECHAFGAGLRAPAFEQIVLGHRGGKTGCRQATNPL